MSEQKKVHITICQAPYASLLERGLYLKMHNPDYTFTEPVPAEYYLTAFDGDIECPEGLPNDKKLRAEVLLEKVFTTFNTAHPAGYCGHSLSVGDVVKLEGKPFLCTVFGFQPIIFAVSKEHPTENPTACPLPLPDGTALRVTVHKDASCPAVNIDLVAADGTESRICFVEHNPDQTPGHELCIGVYHADQEDTAYYGSYVQEYGTVE